MQHSELRELLEPLADLIRGADDRDRATRSLVETLTDLVADSVDNRAVFLRTVAISATVLFLEERQQQAPDEQRIWARLADALGSPIRNEPSIPFSEPAPFTLRNTDVDPDALVEQLGFEGVLTMIERGGINQWGRLVRAIDADPYGKVAREVEAAIDVAREESPAVVLMMEQALVSARSRQDSIE